MRDTVARIAGNHKNVFIARVAADIGHSVCWFHDLPGPVISNLGNKRKSSARPLFQLNKSLSAVIGLPGLVIFASDDEHIALLVAGESHVVVWHRPNLLLLLFRSLRRVPEQRVVNA